ncbi:recombination protein NinG [Pseudomonas pseudonitroreducens]|uniref:recombination protein NinG n=1 Tax=Pseudomonas pseudonitroreducens TaxID=2892326 RepID=UPI001F408B34|nr:recombination protein NinG [Pseudomonas pseudonitroreducens]
MTLSTRQPKPKRCKNDDCGQEFIPRYRSTEKVCSNACALAVGRADQSIQAKARKSLAQMERKELGKRREKLKSRADHLREAQQAFNEFIRLRDAQQPCISCGRHHDGQYHAGHYRTVGANPELRFDEDNVHKQCAPCNNHKSGDIVNYRINLVAKIGAERVARLEGPHEPLKLGIEEIKALKAKYRALVREMKKATENYRGVPA